MRKKNLLVGMCVFVACVCVAVEPYRTFKDVEDRAIIARLIKYDQQSEMVTVQRKGGKKVTVPLLTFSEADQVYIQGTVKVDIDRRSMTVASPQNTPTLTKSRIKEIARQLEDAIEDGDEEAARALFLNPGSVRWDFDRIENVDVRNVEDNYAMISLQMKATDISDGGARLGCYYFAPEGKIKYSSVSDGHPVVVVVGSIYQLRLANRERMESFRGKIDDSLRNLKRVQLPTFGLSRDMPWSDLKDSIEELEDWLEENALTYDVGEPKVYISPKRYKQLKANL